MPFYDMRCADCAKDFTVRASVEDKVQKRVACPECGRHNMETIYRPVGVSVKASAPAAPATCPNAHICGSACAHG
jgi:putative FmdB family regulatory protein